jgi:hypothetical protein
MVDILKYSGWVQGGTFALGSVCLVRDSGTSTAFICTSKPGGG